jgi:fumarylpyruvate hydrolase
MKIIVIGNNAGPKEPYLYLKPDSALLKDNKPFFIPDYTKELTVSLHPVIRISRLGKNIAERFASRYYDAITVGLDLVASDLLERCRINAIPLDISYSFDSSAVIGNFIPIENFATIQALHLKLDKEGQAIQKINTSELTLSADKIIAWVSKYYTLKTGDLIYLGSTSSSKVDINDRLQGYLEQELLFDFHIR